MGKGVAEGIQARHIGVCPRFFPFFPLDGTPEMETPANVNLQGFRSISRRVGDSNPRYSNPVRQFSKLVVSATHPNFLSNQHLFSNAVQMYGKLLDYANLSRIFFSVFLQGNR